jgi:pilus assembly protein Flp/PilA
MDTESQDVQDAPDSRWSWRSDRGASLVEYALLLALIAVVCIGAIGFFGGSTGSALDESGQSMFLP